MIRLDPIADCLLSSEERRSWMRFMGCALLVLLAGVQTGCLALGGGHLGNDRFRQEPAYLTPNRATYSQFHYPTGEYFGPLAPSALQVAPTPKVIRKEELLKAWGPPDEKLVEQGLEQWVYRDGLRWNGVFLFPGIIIPIPLVVPIGWNTFTVEFREDTVSAILTLVNEAKGGGACTFVLVHGGAGCRFGEQFVFDFALKQFKSVNSHQLLGSSN